MMMDYITLAACILAVSGAGIAVGLIVEKIERLDRKREDEEHKDTSKNNRRQYPDKIERQSFFDFNLMGQPSIGSTFC